MAWAIGSRVLTITVPTTAIMSRTAICTISIVPPRICCHGCSMAEHRAADCHDQGYDRALGGGGCETLLHDHGGPDRERTHGHRKPRVVHARESVGRQYHTCAGD